MRQSESSPSEHSAPSRVPLTNLIARIGRDGTLLELNLEQPASASGPDPMLAVGRPVSEVFSAEFASQLLSHLPLTLSTGHAQTFTTQLTRQDHISTYAVKLVAARPDAVMAIVNDITGAQQVEQDAVQLNRALLSLQSAAVAITASLDIEHVLETFVWEMTNLLMVDGCVVYNWQAETQSLSLSAVYPQPDWARGQTALVPPQSVTARVLIERYARQVSLNPTGGDTPEQVFMRRQGVRALLLLPMIFQDRVLGLVEVMDTRRSQPFSDREVSLAQLLVSESATAVINARLYAETQQRLREQTALRRASAIISSSLDLQTVLHDMAEQMAWAIDAAGAYIYRYAPASRQAMVLAEYFHPQAARPEQASRLNQVRDLTDEVADRRHFLYTGRPQARHLDEPDLPPAHRQYMAQQGMQASLSVPMKIGGGLTAYAELWEGRRSRVFSAEEITLIQGIAQQAAIAIENARLYEELEQRLQELATLNEISQSIISTLDLPETLTLITNNARSLMHVAAASVALLEPDGEYLRYAAASGDGADFIRGQRLPKDNGIVGWVVAHGEPLLALDVSQDPRHYAQFDALSGFQTHSMLCVPLQSQGAAIGAIAVLNKRQGAFDQEDIRLLSSLAAPAATAIENARLYTQARQEIAERQLAEARLQAERASLAERVAERTLELSVANAELAHAARLKDEFLASMSHELRTPLNAILGITEGLQEELYGPLNSRQGQSVALVGESGRHLLALINDILDVSKIESGRLALELETIDVRTVCETSLQFVKQAAARKHITIELTLDPTVRIVRADARRLKQILINLLSNAVKFTPERGRIGLECAGDPERYWVHFTVWDTGIGIAQENIQRLFQPFVQLDSSLSRRFAGTGLGLALVRRLAELHGGRVAVASELGQGSRFTVSLLWDSAESLSLPSAPAPPIIQTSLPAETNGAARPLLLLADDDEVNVTIFRELLEMLAYRIVVARNGQEAVTLSQSQRPDLILMDIQMPDMDGLEAIRRIRQIPELAVMPIVALTALAMSGDRELCLAAGANDYLSKPVPLQTLQHTLQRLLHAAPAATSG